MLYKDYKIYYFNLLFLYYIKKWICVILYSRMLISYGREATMQNPVPDERYSVADEAILGAFFKLIKKKTLDQITVSDITKTAGIARSTFYNHYQDIPSLVSAVEEKTIHDVCTFRINGAPFPRQRCKRLAPAVRYPFVVTC